MKDQAYNWQKIEPSVAALAEQEIQLVNAGDQRVCIVKNNGNLYACAEECPHAGFSLSDGYVDSKGYIICPLHSMGFSLINGLDTFKEGYRLKLYPVKMEGNEVFVGLTR